MPTRGDRQATARFFDQKDKPRAVDAGGVLRDFKGLMGSLDDAEVRVDEDGGTVELWDPKRKMDWEIAALNDMAVALSKERSSTETGAHVTSDDIIDADGVAVDPADEPLFAPIRRIAELMREGKTEDAKALLAWHTRDPAATLYPSDGSTPPEQPLNKRRAAAVKEMEDKIKEERARQEEEDRQTDLALRIWWKHSQKLQPDVKISDNMVRNNVIAPLLMAINEGGWTDLLDMRNPVSRATYEEMTGFKLPKTNAGTRSAVTQMLWKKQAPAPAPKPKPAPAPKPKPAPAPKPKPAAPAPKSLPETIAAHFVAGGSFRTIVEARKFIAEHSGEDKAKGGTVEAKVIEETIEHGVVLAARQIIADMDGKPETEVYARLVQLYGQQPNLSTRTGQSMLLQAYSTPVPLAYVVSRLARAQTAQTVYEPTAGTGMLLLEVAPMRGWANELDADRAAILRAQGFNVSENDASTTNPRNTIMAVVANPPFGTVPNPEGGNRQWTLGTQGFTNQIDQAIVQKSLEALGPIMPRGVFIVGSKRDMKTGAPIYDGPQTAKFYRWLYGNWKVTQHFTVSGDLYTKQGAGFPVDVFVIEGRGKSDMPLPSSVAPKVYDSWEALGNEVLDASRKNRHISNQPVAVDGQGPAGSKDADTDGLPKPPRGPNPNDAGQGDAGGGQEGDDTPGGGEPGTGDGGNGPAGTRTPPQQPRGKSGGGKKRVDVPGGDRPAGGTTTGNPPVRTDQPGGVGTSNVGGNPAVGGILGNLSAEKQARAAELKAQLLAKLRNELRSGIDPQMLAIGAELAALYVEAGARAFADFARSIYADLGDPVKPYLKSLYASARNLPGAPRSEMSKASEYEDLSDAEVDALVQPPAAPEAPKAEAPNETKNQVPYEPAAKTAQGLGTVMPRQHAEALKLAFDALREEVGDIEDFVASEMGWTADQMRARLSAEQVDALALSIHQAQNQGGIVVGDQTGIGKGRVVASMIMWAKARKIIPVFITEKPTLYGDMLRDLQDIGQTEPKMLTTSLGLRGQNAIRTDEGGEIDSPANQAAGMARATEFAKAVVEGRETPYLALATMYSQLQGTISKERREFMRSISSRAFFIMDESHNAGGSELSDLELSRQRALAIEKQPRSMFFREMLRSAAFAMYSSATWAKRPGVMDLYSKTAMRYALDNMSNLGPVIKKGGIALQQVISRELVRLGQYIRRERSFEGVAFKTDIVGADREQVGTMTRVFANITAVDRMLKDAKEAYIEHLKKTDPTYRPAADGSIGVAGMEAVEFTSQLHNAIRQMNLAAKVDAASDRIIEHVRKGEKIVIALENTMESVLDDAARDSGALLGASSDVTFASRLHTYLERSMQIIVKRPNDQGGMDHETLTVPRTFWSAEAIKFVDNLTANINSLNFGKIPVSPIDWMHMRLREAGISVGELTGRKRTLNYAKDGSATWGQRPESERKVGGKRKIIRGFQDGDIDVVILNASGATGISLHSDRRAKDQRPRHMFILQPIANIDVFMQSLGRIFRTGQVNKPAYKLLISDIPSEKRPASLLMKKMASLNANVSSARSGDVDFKAPDLFNEVGDYVVNQWMNSDEGSAVLDMMYGPNEDRPDINPSEPGELAQKITGRMAIVDLDVQEEAWDALGRAFESRLELLTAQGENPLELTARDLRARTERSLAWLEPRVGPRSWFTSGAHFEKIVARLNIKPLTWEQIQQSAAESIGASSPSETYAKWNAFIDTKTAAAKKIIEQKVKTSTAEPDEIDEWKAKAEFQVERFRSAMLRVRPGSLLDIAGIGHAVISSVHEREVTKSPIASSRFTVNLRVPDERQHISLSLTDAIGEGVSYILDTSDEIAAFDDFAENPIMRRWVLKGNIMAGLEALQQHAVDQHAVDRDTIATTAYTDQSGKQHIGVMFARNYRDEFFEKIAKERANVLRDPRNAADVLLEYKHVMVADLDRVLQIRRAPGLRNFEAVLPPDRRSSAKYLAMRKAAKAAGGDFVRRSGEQVMDIPWDKLRGVVDAFVDAGLKFSVQDDGSNTSDSAKDLAAAEKQYAGPADRAGGANGASPSQPQRSGALDLADRLEKWANEQARVLFGGGMMRRGPRGSRSGATTLPKDIATYIGIITARALARGIRGGKKLTELIAEAAKEYGGIQADPKIVRRGVLRAIKASGPEGEDFERVFSDLTNPRQNKGQKRATQRAAAVARKAAVGAITGAPPSGGTVDGAEAHREALRQAERASEASGKAAVRAIRKEIDRAYHAGRQNGRMAAEEAIPSLMAQIIRQRSQLRALAEFEARGARDEVAGQMREAQAIRDGIRQQVVDYARGLPPIVRGKLVASIANATTPRQYLQVSRKLQRELLRYVGRATAKWIGDKTLPKKVVRRKGMTDALRGAILAQRAKAAELIRVIRSAESDLTQMRAAVVELVKLKDLVGVQLETSRAMYAQIEEARRMNAMQVAHEVAEDVAAAPAKVLNDTNEEKDVDVNRVVRVWRSVRDVRNAIQEITGQTNSLLERVMWKRFDQAEEEMYARNREIRAQLEGVFKRAGFSSLADAQRRLSGFGGKGMTSMVTVTLGAQERQITLGEAIDLLGHLSDPMTADLFLDTDDPGEMLTDEEIAQVGQRLQTSRGRHRRPFAPTPNELYAFVRQVDPDGNYRRMIDEIKGVLESLRDDSWNVHYILKGFEPEAVDKRWPRSRNIQAVSQTATLPETAADFGHKFIENDGRYIKRSQTKGIPIMLVDPVSMVLDDIERSLKMIYLAIPTRDAANVLLSPQVDRAISAKFGPSMSQALRTHLMHMGRADIVHGTLGARVVATINSGQAVSQLGLNPGTWAVTAVSALRLLPVLGPKFFLEGVKGMGSISRVDLMRKSGHAWDRYEGAHAADRYSAVIGAAAEVSDGKFVAEMGALGSNIMAGDIPAAWHNLGRAVRVTLSILNEIDALIYRIAWAAFDAKARAYHPEWTESRREGWVRKKSRLAMRETQQGSSPIDMAMGPAANRNSGLAVFSLFSSDSIKSRNRIARAWRRGKGPFAAALAAEVASIVVGIEARKVIWVGISAAIAAALGWDDEDKDRLAKKLLDEEQDAINAARELSSLVLPIIGPNLVDGIMAPFGGGNVVDAPAISAVNESFSSAYSAVKRSFDDRKTAKQIFLAWAKAVNAAGALSGRNPLAPFFRRVISEAEAASK